MGYLYPLNFAKSQIIPSINQFEIEPCLLINEPQNLNQASKGYHTEVWMRLDVALKSKHSTISKYPPCVRINATCRIQANYRAFRFLQTSYLNRIGCYLKLWRLAVKTHAPKDAKMTRHYVFENVLVNTCHDANRISKIIH